MAYILKYGDGDRYGNTRGDGVTHPWMFGYDWLEGETDGAFSEGDGGGDGFGDLLLEGP
jgi:hypothetical protein